MTAAAFRAWCDRMQALGAACSMSGIAALLRVDRRTVQRWRKGGTDYATALACVALVWDHEAAPRTVAQMEEEADDA